MKNILIVLLFVSALFIAGCPKMKHSRKRIHHRPTRISRSFGRSHRSHRTVRSRFSKSPRSHYSRPKCPVGKSGKRGPRGSSRSHPRK